MDTSRAGDRPTEGARRLLFIFSSRPGLHKYDVEKAEELKYAVVQSLAAPIIMVMRERALWDRSTGFLALAPRTTRRLAVNALSNVCWYMQVIGIAGK
jgi:hypothetical protein